MINNTYLIALHGDFASGDILKRDMAHLSRWIDEFPDWQMDNTWLTDYIDKNICLLGYSRGGAEIANLSYLDNLKGAVIYEGPNFRHYYPQGNFPILLGWNSLSRPLRDKLRDWTFESWSRHHLVTTFQGRGFHIRRCRGCRPPLGHNWDAAINPDIYHWMTDNLP